MNIIDIISKKQKSIELSKEEIDYFVKEYTAGNIPDYQAAALVMAIYLNGMTNDEVTNLTMAMAYSGEVMDLSSKLNTLVVDKHSTGGVGDKVTLILMPVVASLGIKVAKMSGRGLGFTGGTKDKLESIPGYNTEIGMDDFIKNVNEIGISLIGQSTDIAPADKKLYALRDSISCTDNIPLISSSIMSKKIASGANRLVLDVTVGKGAFMKNVSEAEKLGNTMIEIGKKAGRDTVCILTNMDEPLGRFVGNNLEVIESIKALHGEMEHDVKELILYFGSYMLYLAGIESDIENGKRRVWETIENGNAFNKFKELVGRQGGDVSYIENPDKFEKAKYVLDVYSEKDGYIEEMNAEEIGKISVLLGAGRINKEDSIDYSVGIELNKKTGDKVCKGEVLARIYANDEQKGKEALERLSKNYKIADYEVSKKQAILKILQ